MNHRKLLIAAAALFLTSLTFAQVQSTEPARPMTIRVAEKVIWQNLVHYVAPEYPETARSDRISGTVVVSFRVDSQGNVYEAVVVSGHPLFHGAALDAVKQWRFQPYLLNGAPAEVVSTTSLIFDPSPQKRIHLPPGVMEGNSVYKVDPDYPQEAKDAHIQGDVNLLAVIDQDGNISSLRVVSGHPLFIPPALDAAKRWKYRPFLIDGQAVEVETTIRVRFHM